MQRSRFISRITLWKATEKVNVLLIKQQVRFFVFTASTNPPWLPQSSLLSYNLYSFAKLTYYSAALYHRWWIISASLLPQYIQVTRKKRLVRSTDHSIKRISILDFFFVRNITGKPEVGRSHQESKFIIEKY